MDVKNKDRRVQRTRRALREAFIFLMGEKKFESITVRNILDRADVGRSTFYLHFQDKNELLLDGLQALGESLRRAQAAPAFSGKRHERVIGFSRALFEHAHSHKAIYKRLLAGRGWDIVRPRMEELLVELIKGEAKPLFKRKVSSELSFDLFTHLLGSAFTSVITWWLDQKNPSPPAEIDTVFREVVKPLLAGYLE